LRREQAKRDPIYSFEVPLLLFSTADPNWTDLASEALQQGGEDHEEVDAFGRADHVRNAARRILGRRSQMSDGRSA
jgi:hypothetical protein